VQQQTPVIVISDSIPTIGSSSEYANMQVENLQEGPDQCGRSLQRIQRDVPVHIPIAYLAQTFLRSDPFPSFPLRLRGRYQENNMKKRKPFPELIPDRPDRSFAINFHVIPFIVQS
jgi:hypothetical protein